MTFGAVKTTAPISWASATGFSFDDEPVQWKDANGNVRVVIDGDGSIETRNAAGTGLVKVTSAGLLGVNKTSSLAGQLHVVSADATRPAAVLSSAASPSADIVKIQDNGTDLVVVDQGGNLGVGVVPEAKIHVAHDGNSPAIRAVNSAGGSEAGNATLFVDRLSALNNRVVAHFQSNAGNLFTLRADGATFFAGNVGLGKNPSSLLHLDKAISGTPGTTGPYLNLSGSTFTDDSTLEGGTAASMVFHSVAQPTLAATNLTVTTTNAASVYIAGAPIAGENQTITNAYSLWVAAGTARFDDNVDMTALPTADPLVAGRLWNDAGTVKVSAG